MLRLKEMKNNIFSQLKLQRKFSNTLELVVKFANVHILIIPIAIFFQKIPLLVLKLIFISICLHLTIKNL